MRVGIMSAELAYFDQEKNAPAYEVRQLLSAGKRLDIDVELIDPTKVHFRLGPDGVRIVVSQGGKPSSDIFESLDALLVKRTRHLVEVIADIVDVVTLVHPALSIFDPPGAYVRPTSKVRGYIERARAGILPPDTFVSSSHDVVEGDLDFGYPMLWKPSHGTHGDGILRIRNETDFANILRRSKSESAGYFEYAVHIQKELEIEEEYRVFVIGDSALGAVGRKREAGWNSSNKRALPRASFELAEMSEDLRSLATAAAASHEISFAGVDIVQTKDGLYVLECNRNPQFRGFQEATNIDVAEKILSYIVANS